jgi:hypothetical protein
MKRRELAIFCSLLMTGFGFYLFGCATMESSKRTPYEVTSKGTVIYDGEFEFNLPPTEWKLVRQEGENEFVFGFLKWDSGPFPSQSMFVYDEEPFGCSTGFADREREFFKRFLWNAILNFQVSEKKKVQVSGGEGSEVVVEGKDPVKKEKAKAKVIFAKRGERVVAFYITQWRSIDGTYDDSAFETFDRFVKSFRFLKKSFYETL